MEFGITFKGDLGVERTLNIIKQAEAAGFDYVWFLIHTSCGRIATPTSARPASSPSGCVLAPL